MLARMPCFLSMLSLLTPIAILHYERLFAMILPLCRLMTLFRCLLSPLRALYAFRDAMPCFRSAMPLSVFIFADAAAAFIMKRHDTCR